MVEARIITKATAALIPRALPKFLETPRKEQRPKNWERTILETKRALNTIPNVLSMTHLFSLLQVIDTGKKKTHRNESTRRHQHQQNWLIGSTENGKTQQSSGA